MFILTAKVHRGRLIAGIALLALAIGLIAAGTGLARNIQAQTTASSQMSAKGIKTNEDRIAFLESFGWTVSAKPVSTEEVLIPETFDSSYDEYLRLQAEQGFPLADYAGKTAKRYTYEISNYPGVEGGVWASLLIYKKTVIAGEVYSSQGDGFLRGLDFPEGE